MALDELDNFFTLEWIALSQKVSAARAAEMLVEKLAEGAVAVTATRRRPARARRSRPRFSGADGNKAVELKPVTGPSRAATANHAMTQAQ
jgi:hypothetical protein